APAALKSAPRPKHQPGQVLHRELYPRASVPSDQSGPVIDFRSSDQTLDRYQEVITVAGWKLDSYAKNPVVQNAHSYCSLSDTIGKSIITEVRDDASGYVASNSSIDLATLAHQMGEGSRVRASLSTGERARVRAEFPGPEKTVRSGEGPYLFQRILFAVEENPMAKVAYGLYKGGFLNAVSVGFIPVR